MAQSSIRNLNIDGNLVISGSTTQLNVNTIVVDDNNITINDVTIPTDANANQGGITLKGATDKTINWVDANDAWTLSEHLDIANTKEYRINNVSVLNATTLGSSVVNSSLTSIGALTELTVDNIKIDGSNIGLLTDLNLITLANDTVTVAGTIVALGTPGFTGDGSGITGISTSSFGAPGSNSDIIINSSGTLGAITTVPLAQGGTGGTDAATARTSLGLGTGNSPTFGSISTSGTGTVNIHTAPDSGNNLGLAGVFTRSIPPTGLSGHRFYTGIGNSSGGYVIAHRVTSDAGVDSGTAAVYLWTADAGKKVYIGGTYPSATTTNAYINDLAYPTADGSNGQVITTDGAGTLSFTSVSGIGALLVSNNLSDVASAPTSRTNLGLGTSATQNTGVFAQVANNLSDVTAATARTNLGITATGADTAYAFRANNLSDVTAATARTNLGITASGADTAYAFRANNLSDLTNAAISRTNLGITASGADTAYAFRANNLSDLTNAAISRTNLGLGTIATQAANAVDIDGGAIDGATIGANSAQPATVTTFTSTGIDDNASSTAMTIASNQDTTFAQAIKVGNIAGAAGAGNIRWSGTDFLGYNGSNWVSLTSAATAQISGNIATFNTSPTITSTTYVDVAGYTTAITVTNSNVINVQVNVDLETSSAAPNYWIKLVRVVGGTPTDLYIDVDGGGISGQSLTNGHFNIVYADAHGQSNGTVITYKLMVKVDSGTLTVNPNATNAQIFVYEITTSPVTVSSVNGATGTVVLDSDDIAEGSSNLYYTDVRADARVTVGINNVIDSAPAALNTLNELAAALGDDANFAGTVTTSLAGKEPTITAGTTAQYYRGDKSWQTLNTTSVAESGNLYYTDARADARITAADTGDLSEGSNLYYTDARARAAISESSTQLAYNSSTGVLTYTQGDTDTVAEGSNLYYTDARADARVTPAAVSDEANTSTGSFIVPTGTTAQRPSTPTTGMMRFNSSTSRFEGYNGTAWVPIDTLYS